MNKTGTVLTLDTRDLSSYNGHICSLEVDEDKSVTICEINSFINKVKSGHWIWWKNNSCKYVRIFSMEGECYIFNRYGEQITLEDLEFQNE